LAALGGLAVFGNAAPAQTAPAAAASGTAGTAISERIKKDAAGPLYWIRLNAQKADAVAKPAPRIAEMRPVPAAAPTLPPAVPRAAPSALPASRTVATAFGDPAPALSTLVAPGPVSPADAGSDATAAAQAPVATEAPAAAPAPSGMAAALVAPAVPTAAETARQATSAPVEVDDTPLAVLSATEPEFPPNVVRRLRKGTVQVRFEVQPDGRVTNASVVQTTSRSLDDAALEAVSTWRFKPVRAPRSAVVDLGFDLDG
jgi:TonB family protein